ncbi:MAG: hypothetical protein WBW04_06540 [Nitrolancea sp.]
MKRNLRLATAAFLITALLGTLQFALIGGAAAANGGGITFDSLTPAPFATVEPGPVLIGAHASGAAALTDVKLDLSGSQIEEIGSQTETSLNVSQQQVLTAGTYTATVVAVDADGHQFQAQWDFVVSSNLGDTEWFFANGTPKADQINATMQSLVQAFRWHLYGLSWDGSNHPDLPTHVGLMGTGDPVGPWVTGTIFDQSGTNATLRSLVEAFRWHFWGISWDGADHPDIPTHASTVQGPQSIDPWFDANGNPIQANITATLRSLVESFRWHFWGYSWDGNDHPDLPTHGNFMSEGGTTPPPPTDTVPMEDRAIYQSPLTDLAGYTKIGSVAPDTTQFGAKLSLAGGSDGGATRDNLQVGDNAYSVTLRKVAPDGVTYAGDSLGCIVYRAPQMNASGEFYEYCIVYSDNFVTGTIALLASSSGSSILFEKDIADYPLISMETASSQHTIKVIAKGHDFWFYLDGDYQGTVTDDGPTDGTAGFAGHNLESSGLQQIEFSFFSVKSLK